MKKSYHYEFDSLLKRILNDELVYFKAPTNCPEIAMYRIYKKFSLEEANLETVGSIEAYAFGYCNNLKKLTLGTGITSIARSAFVGCTALKTVIFTGTIEEWNNLPLSTEWYKSIPAESIQCIDGTVQLIRG